MADLSRYAGAYLPLGFVVGLRSSLEVKETQEIFTVFMPASARRLACGFDHGTFARSTMRA